MEKPRCINLDWLECYCLEDRIGYPHDAEFFRRAGFHVVQREYGTPVYHEMFTLYDHHDQPFIEVRRRPKSAIGQQINGVLHPDSCHIRLSNRTCYFNEPARIMQQFLEQYGLNFQRISRIDIALDFEKFDSGDDPIDFVDRFMRHKYSKINQAEIAVHGRDLWDGRRWNSLKWGQPKSMISTKLYNKTMELEQRHDKPYIRQAWREAHLVDDEYRLVRFNDDKTETKVDVWRVEFAIKSGTRNWFVMEDCSGKKSKLKSVRNTLDMYYTREQQLSVFWSLCDHYFHFKKFQAATRKDRCEDKVLFKPALRPTFYKLENVATQSSPDHKLMQLIKRLTEYRDSHVMPDIYKACNTLIEALEREARTTSLVHPWPKSELAIIQQLIARRIHCQDKPLNQDRAEIEALLQLYPDAYT